MSQRPGWLSAVLLVAAANLIPLAGWWWNSAGEPVTTVELSEREAGVQRGGDENTSIWLQLWRADSWGPRPDVAWADSSSLTAIGFEAERLVTGETVALAPRKPHRRPAWVLLRIGNGEGTTIGSRLEPVAIGADPGALYRLAGDPGGHLVMRGVVRVGREMPPVDSLTGVSPGETWSASLDWITPASLHVPRSLVTLFEGLAPDTAAPGASRYLVRVAMGRLHLPRIIGVLPTLP